MSDLIKQNGELIKQVAETLERAKLENLTETELKKIASAVMVDQLKQELQDRVKASKVDIETRFEEFIQDKAENTQAIYRKAWQHYRDYCSGKGIDPLFVKAREADSYVRFLNASQMSKSTVRMYMSAISAFYSMLERWEDVSTNPFRGARRPKNETPVPQVPTDGEIETMIRDQEATLNSEGRGANKRIEAARLLLPAIHIMSRYGLRAGALPTLEIKRSGEFTARSKGKQITGTFDPETLELLKRLDLGNRPFEGIGESTIRGAMRNLCTRLKDAGSLEAVYSPHDLRHHFATRFYRESGNDLISTMRALNHTSVQTTQNYLRTLGIDTE